MKAKTAALRAVFMQHLTQALKTKTGAVQTQAVKRIFHLAVRDLHDDQLSGLNRLLDYAPRGMHPAYYVNVAESVIVKLSERESGASRGAGLAWVGRHPEGETDESIDRKTHAPKPIKSVMERMGWG